MASNSLSILKKIRGSDNNKISSQINADASKWLFSKKRSLMTSEVTEVTEVNYLEVTKELFISVVLPKNGSFHDL